MSIEFSLCLLTVFVLAAFGSPIAISMLVGAIVYLISSGQDIALAGEQYYKVSITALFFWRYRYLLWLPIL